MQKIIPALALLSSIGCGLAPGSIVLVFPNDQAKADAAHATFEVVRPTSPGDDECMRYLEFAEPDPNLVVASPIVDLMNGVPTQELKGIPTGFETLLVKVTNGQNVLILHGCQSGNIGSGAMFAITLSSTNASPPDLSTTDASSGDLSSPDMTAHRYLQITASELRASSRKLSGVIITIQDSASATVTAPPTDATGVVKVDTAGMTPPFVITASAPTSNGYQGAVTLSDVNPTFGASDTVALQIPIELDPPAISASNVINVTVPDATAAQTFNAYFIGASGIPSDQQTLSWSGNAAFGVQPLEAGSYRLALLDTAQNKVATPNAIISAGNNYTAQLTGGLNPGDFKAYSSAFSLGVVKSTNAAYATQQYGAVLVLPASQTQAAIPIFPVTNFTVTGTVTPTPLPAMPNTVQASAVLLTEMIAFGANARGELRHLLSSPTPASDAFGTSVPDPPVVVVTPSPVLAASSFTITATPPGTLPISTSFLYVTIHDTATPQKYHWHLVAPAANPTTVVAPASIVPAGTYAIDVGFIQDFQPLADGTVQATIADDYTKLIRLVPAQLSQSTSTLTVN